MYIYNASLLRVVDGDTVWLRVDLGFRMYAEMSFRLLGINAPELNESGGLAAKGALLGLLEALGPTFVIQTSKADKYGRWLVTIGKVNALMIEQGHAVPYLV